MGDTPTAHQNMKASSNVGTIVHTNVFVWDMDETLILLKSLLDGTYAKSFNGSKNLQKGIEIGKCWENHILDVCDKYFFYEDIENYNEPFLGSLSQYDDRKDLSDYDFHNDALSHPHDDANKRKIAYRHRIITNKYEKGLHDVIDQQMKRRWDDLYNQTDTYTDRWLSSGRALLEEVARVNKMAESASGSASRCKNINILVTSGSLIPSLVKLLLFRLDDLFSHENVYSSWEVGKLQCFKWIKDRFTGPGVRFCAVGDGMEECHAAQKLNWPFLKIDLHPGGPHRFPGITMKMIESYMDVIYGQRSS